MYTISYDDFRKGIYEPLETILDLGIPVKAHKQRYRKDSDDFYYEFKLQNIKIGNVLINIPYTTTWENEDLPKEFVEAINYLENVDSTLKKYMEGQMLEFVLGMDCGNSHWCDASLHYHLLLNGEKVKNSTTGFYHEVPDEKYVLALSGLFPEKYDLDDYKEKYREERKIKQKQESIKLLSEKVYPLIEKAQQTGKKSVEIVYEYNHYTEHAMFYLDKQYKAEFVPTSNYMEESKNTYIVSW